VADLALRMRQFPEVDAAFALMQIEGWQKARTKLPTLAAIPGWTWPKRLSMEQCSSEECAALKLRILRASFRAGADLTGGMGVDSYYLSEGAERWTYVEMQKELAGIAERNFALTDRKITVRCTTAEAELEAMEPTDLIFLDPARRDGHGGKVFRLQDCTPDVTQLYPALMAKCRTLALKLSPMLDLTEALRQLPDAKEAYVVALRNEVKELLIVCAANDKNENETSQRPYEDENDISLHAAEAAATLNHASAIVRGLGRTKNQKQLEEAVKITAINITAGGEQHFSFTEAEEQEAVSLLCTEVPTEGYLYEPNAAILKAGAFKLVGQRYDLRKLAASTHLYWSPEAVEGFPGRTFHITGIVDKTNQKSLAGQQANILTRNYPLRPEELRKKLKMKDGGEQYVIGARVGEKAAVFLAEKE